MTKFAISTTVLLMLTSAAHAGDKVVPWSSEYFQSDAAREPATGPAISSSEPSVKVIGTTTIFNDTRNATPRPPEATPTIFMSSVRTYSSPRVYYFVPRSPSARTCTTQRYGGNSQTTCW